MTNKDSLNVDMGIEGLTPMEEVVVVEDVMVALVVKLVETLMGSRLNLDVLKLFVVKTGNDVSCCFTRLDNEYCPFELEANVLLGREDVMSCIGRINGPPCGEGDPIDVLLGEIFMAEATLPTTDLIDTSLLVDSPIRWLSTDD